MPRIAERGIVGKALGESGSVEVGAGISYRYSDLSFHEGGVLRRFLMRLASEMQYRHPDDDKPERYQLRGS